MVAAPLADAQQLVRPRGQAHRDQPDGRTRRQPRRARRRASPPSCPRRSRSRPASRRRPTRQAQTSDCDRTRSCARRCSPSAASPCFVGAFIIFNTFSITVAQRLREFAMLRTLGASRRQVLTSVVVEALVMGVVASVVGPVRRPRRGRSASTSSSRRSAPTSRSPASASSRARSSSRSSSASATALVAALVPGAARHARAAGRRAAGGRHAAGVALQPLRDPTRRSASRWPAWPWLVVGFFGDASTTTRLLEMGGRRDAAVHRHRHGLALHRAAARRVSSAGRSRAIGGTSGRLARENADAQPGAHRAPPPRR